MNIQSSIRLGNDAELGSDRIQVSTTCHGFLTLHLSSLKHRAPCLELDRRELREFLARTEPEFVAQEHYRADSGVPMVDNRPGGGE